MRPFRCGKCGHRMRFASLDCGRCGAPVPVYKTATPYLTFAFLAAISLAVMVAVSAVWQG